MAPTAEFGAISRERKSQQLENTGATARLVGHISAEFKAPQLDVTCTKPKIDDGVSSKTTGINLKRHQLATQTVKGQQAPKAKEFSHTAFLLFFFLALLIIGLGITQLEKLVRMVMVSAKTYFLKTIGYHSESVLDSGIDSAVHIHISQLLMHFFRALWPTSLEDDGYEPAKEALMCMILEVIAVAATIEYFFDHTEPRVENDGDEEIETFTSTQLRIGAFEQPREEDDYLNFLDNPLSPTSRLRTPSEAALLAVEGGFLRPAGPFFAKSDREDMRKVHVPAYPLLEDFAGGGYPEIIANNKLNVEAAKLHASASTRSNLNPYFPVTPRKPVVPSIRDEDIAEQLKLEETPAALRAKADLIEKYILEQGSLLAADQVELDARLMQYYVSEIRKGNAPHTPSAAELAISEKKILEDAVREAFPTFFAIVEGANSPSENDSPTKLKNRLEAIRKVFPDFLAAIEDHSSGRKMLQGQKLWQSQKERLDEVFADRPELGEQETPSRKTRRTRRPRHQAFSNEEAFPNDTVVNETAVADQITTAIEVTTVVEDTDVVEAAAVLEPVALDEPVVLDEPSAIGWFLDI